MHKRVLLKKIRKEFPHLKWTSAKHNVEGWDHYVLMLDDKYVFRFPRMKEYLDLLHSEIPLLNYLKDKVNIPIPSYSLVSKDKTFAGYPMLAGKQLKKEIFEKLPNSTKVAIAKQMGRFLTVLHTIPLAKLKQYHLPKFDPKKDYQILIRDLKKLVYPRISKKERVMIEDVVVQLHKYIKVPHYTFTHNDLFPQHLILSPNKKSLSGIIDWSDRIIDDPAIDFSEIWVYGRKFVLDTYKYYRGPKDKAFIERSEVYYKRTPLWVMTTHGHEGPPWSPFKLGYKLFKQVYLNKN